MAILIPHKRHETVGSSKQMSPIDQKPGQHTSSFPFCYVVMSLDVIATTTPETGQPTFCPSDWTAALHWRAYWDSWWNNTILFQYSHIINCHINKCGVAVIITLPFNVFLLFALNSSGPRMVLGSSAKVRPDGSLKIRMIVVQTDMTFTHF